MFKELIIHIAKALKKADLPYMIIGGQAVLLYGEPRMTKDIDITLGVDVGHLEAVVAMLRSVGLEIIPSDYEAFAKRTYVLPAHEKESGIRVDFIFSFTPYEQHAIERALPVMMDEIPVMFASVEDVIIHKIFAGRPRDLEDVRSMLLKNSEFDVSYVKQWLAEFDGPGEKDGLKNTFDDILLQTKSIESP